MVFINYRQDDTRPLARALAEALRSRFGPEQVFLDESSIRDGSQWREVLRRTLGKAKVVLSLIGPKWLSCADQYGRRRIDDPEDWVRAELRTAKRLKRTILVRTVSGQPPLTAKEALPKDLQWLAEIQSLPINDNRWYEDIHHLVRDLEEYLEVRERIPLPSPSSKKRKAQALSLDQVARELKALDGWEPVQSLYPPRQELRKFYVFDSFQKAVGFMEFVAPLAVKENHHPRWENEWKTVTVYFSTWDVRCRVTRYDIRAARLMDEWYESYLKRTGSQ